MPGRPSWLEWRDQELRPDERRRAVLRGRRVAWEGGIGGGRIEYVDDDRRVVAETRAALAAGRRWLWARKGGQTAPLIRVEAGADDWARLRFHPRKDVCWFPPLPDEQKVYFHDAQIGPPEAEVVEAEAATTTNEAPGVRARRAAFFFEAGKHHSFPKNWNSGHCLRAALALHPDEPLLKNLHPKTQQNAWKAAKRLRERHRR